MFEVVIICVEANTHLLVARSYSTRTELRWRRWLSPSQRPTNALVFLPLSPAQMGDCQLIVNQFDSIETTTCKLVRQNLTLRTHWHTHVHTNALARKQVHFRRMCCCARRTIMWASPTTHATCVDQVSQLQQASHHRNHAQELPERRWPSRTTFSSSHDGKCHLTLHKPRIM